MAHQDRNSLGSAPIPGLIVKYALPTVVALVVNNTYNLADQIFISRTVGHLGIAATAVAYPITTLGLVVALTLGGGGAAMAAIKQGESNRDDAERITSCSFFWTAVLSVVMTAAGLFFCDGLLRFFGASSGVLPYARDYGQIILIGLIFSNLSVGLTAFIRNDGAPGLSMAAMIAGAALNIVLDCWLVLGLDMGVKGAAASTVIAQAFSSGLCLWYLFFKASIRIRVKYLLTTFGLLWNIVRLGFSSCVKHLANSAVSVTLNRSIYHYGELAGVGGDLAQSGLGAVSKISMLMLSVIVGISTGCQPIFGYNKGSGNLKRVRTAYWWAVGASTAVAVLFSAASVLFPRMIIALLGSREVGFAVFAEKALVICMLGFFTSGFQVVTANFFMAIGKPLKATILSMLQQIGLLIPLALALPVTMGVNGILFAAPAADLAATAVMAGFIFVEMRGLKNNP